MSSRKSSPVPKWAAKSPGKCSSRRQQDVANDSLMIEDLDLNDLDESPDVATTSWGRVSKEENSGSNDAFGERVPEVVSEASLKNDFYILVKVPTNPRRYAPTLNKASQTRSCGSSPNTSTSGNPRIFSIKEEEEHRTHIQPRSRGLSWAQDPPEEFPSKTHILRYSGVNCLPNQVPEHIEELPKEQEEIGPQSCPDQIEIQELNLGSSCIKGHTKVSLDNYGILVTPTKKPKTDNLLVFQVDTEQESDKSGTSCFDWFAKCLRRRRRRNDLMHAKVYKTYFVKWKKCAECPRCQANRALRRNST